MESIKITEKDVFDLKLNGNEVGVILKSLNELPAKISRGVINNIEDQIDEHFKKDSE